MSDTMEAIGNDLRQMQRTPLAASHVDALRVAGKVVTYPAGVFLAPGRRIREPQPHSLQVLGTGQSGGTGDRRELLDPASSR
jgi:hypothetical protein